MLSKITATTLLMAAIAIGSPVLPTAKNGTISAESNTPVMELAEPANSTVKHDSLAGNGTHLVRTFSQYDRIECRFQFGENKFEEVQDSVCMPLDDSHKDEEGCPSFYVQPYFAGRDQVVDKYGRQTDDVTCKVEYYYEDHKCSGPSPRSYTQGRDIDFESAMLGFCATGTTDYNISMSKGASLKCPKSYAITCHASREAGVKFKEEKDPNTGRIGFVEVKPDLSED